MEAASQTVAAAPEAATQQVAQAVPGGATVTSTPSAETAQLAAAPSGPEVQTPVQSYAPADVQAQPASFTQAPTVAPAAQAVPAQSAAPIGVQPSQPVGGPGAAAAATLRFPQPSPAELQQVVTEKPIVSSTLAPDLAQFLRKTK